MHWKQFFRQLVTRGWPLWARYLSTALLVGSAFAIRQTIGEAAGHTFLLFFPAVMLASLLFNRGSGILATILSAALAAYLLEPFTSLRLADPANVLALAIFVGTGLVTAALAETLHASLVDLDREHDEKDLLLREFAHRTRNDLAAIHSLLQVQAQSLEQADREHVLRTAERVRLIARVNRRLTARDRRLVVDSREFIGELCDDLRQATSGPNPISLRADVDSCPIESGLAVSIGLMINELVTNATKYAFPDEKEGERAISVSFRCGPSEHRLEVADNGFGMSEVVRGTGSGHRLIRTLASQWDGAFMLGPAAPTGTRATITLPTG